MFTAVESLTGSLIEVKSFVGKSVSDMLADPVVKANFTVKQESRYDNTVGEGIILEQNPETGSYESGKEITVVVSDGPRMVNVPKIENITAQQAIVLLKESDLYYEKITQPSSSVREGYVIKCEPSVSTVVPAGTTIKIYVAVDTSVKQVKVPNVVGSEMQIAMNKMYEQGLAPTVQEGYNSKYEAGVVYGQSISGDTEVDSGTEIILYVSLGAESANLPTDYPVDEEDIYNGWW
jgi:serine/threonine-protein kinase